MSTNGRRSPGGAGWGIELILDDGSGWDMDASFVIVNAEIINRFW
jgi:hypothetical protein